MEGRLDTDKKGRTGWELIRNERTAILCLKINEQLVEKITRLELEDVSLNDSITELCCFCKCDMSESLSEVQGLNTQKD